MSDRDETRNQASDEPEVEGFGWKMTRATRDESNEGARLQATDEPEPGEEPKTEVEGHMMTPMADRVAAERSRDYLSEAERVRRSDQASSGQGGGVLGGLRDRLRPRGGDHG